ncbi:MULTISPECIES: hypothetical protein [Nocardia]|uniref:Uncharacterized protein n=2 Tax=Nocardia TaxID=1817 RepID=A0A4R6PV63_NOCIG|nr:MULTISPECIES: hypothetical protein [Nocardia]NKX87888.1 hypothetical protein [Nocardia coubleae]TDP42758.1 hypothetical protein DFR75_1011876 [Nocardia ignorata]
MTYLLALIAIVAIAVLCWKAFGPERPSPNPGPAARRPILGPDDDPEFLWRLRKQPRDDSGPEA